jgi:hypothetical protein
MQMEVETGETAATVDADDASVLRVASRGLGEQRPTPLPVTPVTRPTSASSSIAPYTSAPAHVVPPPPSPTSVSTMSESPDPVRVSDIRDFSYPPGLGFEDEIVGYGSSQPSVLPNSLLPSLAAPAAPVATNPLIPTLGDTRMSDTESTEEEFADNERNHAMDRQEKSDCSDSDSD